jgi:hypothetical protein
MPKKFRKDIPSQNNSPTQKKEFQKGGVSFSFKYFQENHDKFSVQQKEANYRVSLIERLKALSSLGSEEILSNRSKALRCHPIRWDDTTESGFGIPNESLLVDTPYQFSLSSNAYGRVHGFFIDEVFYVVWLDPNHRLYN